MGVQHQAAPARGLEAEGRGHRVLGERASGHRGVAVLGGEPWPAPVRCASRSGSTASRVAGRDQHQRPCRGCPGWWRPGGRTARPPVAATAAVRSATSGMTGLPPARARSARSADVEAVGRVRPPSPPTPPTRVRGPGRPAPGSARPRRPAWPGGPPRRPYPPRLSSPTRGRADRRLRARHLLRPVAPAGTGPGRDRGRRRAGAWVRVSGIKEDRLLVSRPAAGCRSGTCRWRSGRAHQGRRARAGVERGEQRVVGVPSASGKVDAGEQVVQQSAGEDAHADVRGVAGACAGRQRTDAQCPSASVGTRPKPVKSTPLRPRNPPVTGSRRSEPGAPGREPSGSACQNSISASGTGRPRRRRRSRAR